MSPGVYRYTRLDGSTVDETIEAPYEVMWWMSYHHAISAKRIA